jgi:dihydrofolate synthase/folylpolyglutamate synthase
MTLDQWLRHIELVHFRSMDLQLDRVSAVLKRLLPDGPGFDAINVAGTNGKGSAVEIITAVLCEIDMCVGTYTSPHLVNYAERIRVDGKEAGESAVCSAFEAIERARGDTPLTYFEFGTLAALFIFQRRGVSLAVLEVGMGGRLDAVNAVNADVALVTSVALDHEHWLGVDRECIAVEKAGIFRPGRPAICADPEPPRAISKCARKVGAELYQLGTDFRMEKDEGGWRWVGPEHSISGLLAPALIGSFQSNNIAGAIMALMSVKPPLRITAEQLRSALASVRMRGRFELIEGSPEIVLDVAHNMAAISGLRNNLADRPCPGRTLAVCGMLKDKPVRAMSHLLGPVVDEWHIGSIHDARGCSAKEMAREMEAGASIPVSTHDSVVSAFKAAQRAANPDDRIVVFGSFYTVGDIIRVLENNGHVTQ